MNAICQGITANCLPRSMIETIFEAASSADIINGIGYGLPDVIGVDICDQVPTVGYPMATEEDLEETVNIVEPGTMYGEQTNLVDLRISKIFRFAKYRASVNLDLANAFNSSGVTTMNNNYAAWQVPTGIHQARLAKISANFDF